MLTKDKLIKDLKEENSELDNYFRNTMFSQLFLDKDLKLQRFTPPAINQFKLTNNHIGRSIHDMQNNFRYPSLIDNINWVIESNEILEKEIQTTDLKWYQMNIVPCQEKLCNKHTQIMISFVEITNRIIDLKEQEKIISEYETLLDTISHDIRNRLTGMSLSLQLMNGANLENNEEIKLYLDTFESGINKINIILAELVASRDQKHKYEAIPELINIENILEDVKFALIHEIKTTKTTIKWQVNTSEIVFPRRQLRSILYNLLSNAIKFRSPDRDPDILIKTIRENNHMVITVKDNGIGIDPKNLDDIFSKFFRIEKSIEGTGVGLHLVKTVVTNAGGRIEIESQLGVGTEFKIYLISGC